MLQRTVCLFFSLLYFYQFSFAQNPDLRRYINNIVDIDGGNFGFIVGSKGEETLYFVTAGSAEDEPPAALDVRFYRSSLKARSVLVKKFSVKTHQLYLYAVKPGAPVKWEAYSYSSVFQSTAPFYSFLDNGKIDSLWYINSSKLTVNDKISNDVIQLNVGREDLYHKGMPVVDEMNRVVGIIAQSQSQNATNDIAFSVIDMKSVAKQLDDFSKCNYFKLIPYGQSATPCEVQKKIVEQETKEQQLAKEENLIYPIAVGPAFGTNLNLTAGTSEYGLSAFGYSLGMNVYLFPDKGRFKVTLKPRYTYSPLKVPAKFETVNSIGYRPQTFRLRELEVPVMLEFITRRHTESAAGYIGLGYVPGYQLPYVYKYTTTAQPKTTKATESSASGMISKVAVELGLEANNFRVSLLASYQITPWYEPNYSKQINGRAIYPAQGAGLSYLLIGLDVAFRLKGAWGLKSR